MGGATPRIYTRPVLDYPAGKWRSTFSAHTRRTPPSREPGVDYYCPLGTELVALGDGYVSEIGGSIHPASGRYVRVNLDNGQAFRLLHLGPRHSLIPLRGRVEQGQPIAISGASGYGSEYFGASSPNDRIMLANTGGPHTHLSLFPRWGAAYADTIDPEPWIDETRSVTAKPIPEDDDMTTRLIRHENGTINVFDEFGSVHAPDLMDGGVGLGEYLETLGKLFGAADQLTPRQWDLANMYVRNRSAQIRDQISNVVLAKLSPVVAGNQPIALDPELIRSAVREALEGGVDADLDETTIDAIANRVLDRQHERLAE